MPEYSCPRCGYNSNIKTYLHKHFLRKKPCTPSCSDISVEECYEEVLGDKYPNITKVTPNDPQMTSTDPQMTPNFHKMTPNDPQMTPCDNKVYECRYCYKVLSKNSHLHRHMRICKDREVNKEEFNQLKNLLVNKDALLEEKDKIMLELKKQIEILLTKVGNTTHNTTNNTININIRAFGKENLQYIKGGFVKELISNGPYSAIPKLLKEIHFNPEHKENCNVLIPNRKEKYAKRYNGEKWELADKNLTLEDMTDRAFNVLTDYGESKKFDRFYDDYDDQDTGLLKKMKSDTEMMILNNQEA